MTVRSFGGVIKATVEAQRRPGRGTTRSPLVDHCMPATWDEHAPCLLRYRSEALALLIDGEAKAMGQTGMSTRQRRNARRRRDRAAASVVATPEGRIRMQGESAAIEQSRSTARTITQAVPAFREVLGQAMVSYGTSCAELNLTSATARGYAMSAAIFEAASTKLLADAFAMGTNVMTGSRSVGPDPKGVHASIAIPGFASLGSLASTFITKSQVCLEHALRIEDRCRVEGRERNRPALWNAPTSFALSEADDDDDDDEEDVPEARCLGHGEHGEEVSASLSVGTSSDDSDGGNDGD